MNTEVSRQMVELAATFDPVDPHDPTTWTHDDHTPVSWWETQLAFLAMHGTEYDDGRVLASAMGNVVMDLLDTTLAEDFRRQLGDQ